MALVIVVALGGFGVDAYRVRAADALAATGSGATASVSEQAPIVSSRCDGRTHCSQMTSCSEAKFFLRNCPGAQMDGDHDGIPCEQQWCTSFLAE